MQKNSNIFKKALIAGLFCLFASPPGGHNAKAEVRAPDLAITGQSGEQFPLRLQLSNEIPRQFNLVVFDGVPTNMTFSAGFRSAQKWYVAVADISSLQATLNADFEGALLLQANFLRVGSEATLTQTISIQVKRKRPNAPDASAPPQSPLTEPEEAEMLKQGADFLRIGDLAAARSLYEELAAEKSAKGALAMGQSYDPIFLVKSMSPGGPKPDVEKARYWYLKAIHLGSEDARTFLATLQH